MQPVPYTRQSNFTSFSTNYPSTQQPGPDLDAEFNHLKTTIDAILANLKLIQRDDAQLASQSVGIDQLRAELAVGLNPSVPWVTGTPYALRAVVVAGNGVYYCTVAHTSGVFATDLAAGDWLTIVDLGPSLATAASSATTATTQAGVATTQAGNAAGSATAANTSAVNAANSAAAAASSAGTLVTTLVDVASAGTCNIGAAATQNVRITGTTTVNAFDTITAGTFRRVRAAAAFQLTYNATSMILPGAANIAVAAGDAFDVISLGAGNWVMTDYQRASGLPLVSPTIPPSYPTPNPITGAAAIGTSARGTDVQWSGAAGAPTVAAGTTMGACSFGFQNTNDGRTNTGAALLTMAAGDTLDGHPSIYVYPGESFSIDGPGGANAAWTTRGRARKGNWVFALESLFSTVSTLDLTAGFTDPEIDDVRLVLRNVSFSAAAELLGRVRSAGAALSAANYYSHAVIPSSSSTSYASAADVATTQFEMTASIFANSLGMEITIFDVRNTTAPKSITALGVTSSNAPAMALSVFGGVYSANAAIDGFRFIPSAGTMSGVGQILLRRS